MKPDIFEKTMLILAACIFVLMIFIAVQYLKSDDTHSGRHFKCVEVAA